MKNLFLTISSVIQTAVMLTALVMTSGGGALAAEPNKSIDIETAIKQMPYDDPEIRKMLTEYREYVDLGMAECKKKFPAPEKISGETLIRAGDCFVKYDLYKARNYWIKAADAKDKHSMQAIERLLNIYKNIDSYFLTLAEFKRYLSFIKKSDPDRATIELADFYFDYYGNGADKNNLDFWKAHAELSKLPINQVTALHMLKYIIDKGMVRAGAVKNEMTKLCEIYDRYVPALDIRNPEVITLQSNALYFGICKKKNHQLGDHYTFNAAFYGDREALRTVSYLMNKYSDREKQKSFYKVCIQLNKRCYDNFATEYLDNISRTPNPKKAVRLFIQGAKADDEFSISTLSNLLENLDFFNTGER